jgi:hypothetical protein
MKKLLLAFLLCASPAFGSEYIEGLAGLGQDGYGFRLGSDDSRLDRSLGYYKHDDQGDVHTLSAELAKSFYYKGLWFKTGGGIGYSMPNADFGKADNGISYILGAGAEYPLSEQLTVGLFLKGFFFNGDVRWTTWDVQDEILSDGTPVQTVTPIYNTDSKSYNKVLLGVAVRFY